MAQDDIAPLDNSIDEDDDLTAGVSDELQLVTLEEEEDPIGAPERESMRDDRLSEPDTFIGPRDQQDPTLLDGENVFEDEESLGSDDLDERRDVPLGMHVIDPNKNEGLDDEDLLALKEVNEFEEDEA